VSGDIYQGKHKIMKEISEMDKKISIGRDGKVKEKNNSLHLCSK